MTVIESQSSNPAPVLRTAVVVVLIAVGFFLPRLLGGSSVAYSTLTTIAIFAVMCYGVDIVLSYLGEVSLGHTLFWADRRLHGGQSFGEIRHERLEHRGRDDRALHHRRRIPRGSNPADAGIRVFAGDLCGGGGGL